MHFRLCLQTVWCWHVLGWCFSSQMSLGCIKRTKGWPGQGKNCVIKKPGGISQALLPHGLKQRPQLTCYSLYPGKSQLLTYKAESSTTKNRKTEPSTHALRLSCYYMTLNYSCSRESQLSRNQKSSINGCVWIPNPGCKYLMWLPLLLENCPLKTFILECCGWDTTWSQSSWGHCGPATPGQQLTTDSSGSPDEPGTYPDWITNPHSIMN